MAVVTSPDVTITIDQSYFLAALGGPQHPQSYLDRFPEAIYNTSLDSHLTKFMYALLGPSGVGWLRKNYLEARLVLEDYGIETFDLEDFYGDPIRFGRILEEVYDEDPRALLPRDKWEEIKAKDAAYRSRAIDYVNGARAGNTPLGMRLVARSGLGHEVEIVENYRYLYDQLSDDQLGLVKQGVTNSTEEMVVLPRRDLPQSEIQVVTITNSPTGGTFVLYFPVGNVASNSTAPIAYNADRSAIQLFLESIPSIGANNAVVTGGPLPDTPVKILFTGDLGFRDVPQLQATNSLTGPSTPLITVTTEQSGVNQIDEVVAISPRDQHYLDIALGHIKPVTTIVTYGKATGIRSQQIWNDALATSTYNEVQRYVAGQIDIRWPDLDNEHWIESGVEHQAPRSLNDLQHHYRGFHNIGAVNSYTEAAIADPNYGTDDWPTASALYVNDHVGGFSQYQRLLFPVLNQAVPTDFVYSADRVLADYAEPLTVSASTDAVQLVNGIYPVDYTTLSGVPEIRYRDEQFWASVERTEGDDYLEIDFGKVQAVNYLYFEATRKSYDIEISYDILDLAPAREWRTITLEPDIPSVTNLGYDAVAQNPWQQCEIWFTNSRTDIIYTRFLRLKFSRRSEANSPFNANGIPVPYSIEVRNLRAARNIS